MIHVILDLDTANQVGAFRSEAAALADVREAVDRFGRAYAAAWGLAVKGDDGAVEVVAQGEALIEMAFGDAVLRRTGA